MGTCLDWHTTITAALPSTLSASTASALAIEWRHAYFDANTARMEAGLPPEDIDTTHRRVLDSLLRSPKYADLAPTFTPTAIDTAITAWHLQKAWPDVSPAIRALKNKNKNGNGNGNGDINDGPRTGYETYVHANGTTRLQLDLVRSADLASHFDMLFSSELLGCYKPAPEAYLTALKLIKRQPEECIMVAAHADDLRGAKAVGMRTVYVHRWTDDVAKDMEIVRRENDAFLEGGMDGLGDVVESL